MTVSSIISGATTMLCAVNAALECHEALSIDAGEYKNLGKVEKTAKLVILYLAGKGMLSPDADSKHTTKCLELLARIFHMSLNTARLHCTGASKNRIHEALLANFFGLHRTAGELKSLEQQVKLDNLQKDPLATQSDREKYQKEKKMHDVVAHGALFVETAFRARVITEGPRVARSIYANCAQLRQRVRRYINPAPAAAPAAAICPITHAPIRVRVRDVRNPTHVYEEEAILRLLATNPKSPIDGSPMNATHLQRF